MNSRAAYDQPGWRGDSTGQVGNNMDFTPYYPNGFDVPTITPVYYPGPAAGTGAPPSADFVATEPLPTPRYSNDASAYFHGGGRQPRYETGYSPEILDSGYEHGQYRQTVPNEPSTYCEEPDGQDEDGISTTALNGSANR